jgi:hypothetical protein
MQFISRWLKVDLLGGADTSVESLKLWNMALAVLFGIQGFALLLFGGAYNVPINVLFLTKDIFQTQLAHHMVLSLAVHQLGTINVAYLVVGCFFIAAMLHLIAATFKRVAYESGIKKSMNLFRWAEYSISALLMLVVLAVLAGISDLGSLILIAAFGVMVGVSSVLTEQRLNAATKHRSLYVWSHRIIAVAAPALPLLVILLCIISTNVFATAGEPLYLYLMFGTIALFFGAVCCNTYLIRVKKDGWAQYVYGERWYMIFSFVAKTLLAWEIFAAVLHS